MTLTEEMIVERMDKLPSFPSVLPRVQAALADPRCTVASLEEIIRPDAAITANILAIVNSAAYGLRRQVGSVRQALALLGNRRVLDVVTAAAYSRLLPDELPGYRIDSAAFWRHCLAVGLLSLRLHRELPEGVRGEISPDGLFTAALLHDLGKLAICVFLEDTMDETLALLRAGDLDFREAEARVLGTDHTRVGERLARKWKLPESVIFVARWHHEPSQAPRDLRRQVSLVHVANVLAHTLGFGADAGELARGVDDVAVGELGIDLSHLDSVAADTFLELESFLAAVSSTRGSAA